MSKSGDNGVAIVGMAALFPGAPDLATYWRNITAGVDSISEIPEHRWESEFFDPQSTAVDRFPVRRGGVVPEPLFDALAHGIMPVAAKGAEPDQLVMLDLGVRALADAGYGEGLREFDRGATAVMLGRGNYIGAGMTRLEQHVRTSAQLVTCLRTLVPGITEKTLAAVKAEFQSKLGAYGGDTAIGLVPNLTASRLANRLNLRGPAYTLDAACASALVATDLALRELLMGRAAVALAGGVHLTHDVAFWSVFAQLQALSHSGCIRPLDRLADGLLPGEGGGMLVLKRLADAERDGDRIYAVLRGAGVASDGRGAGLMVPRIEGQLLALERAWSEARHAPEEVGLIEAHGTATPVGDAAELETLARFFGKAESDGPPRAVIGSVKSMIGHAMPAAGAASLIKTALAVYHGVLPPTLHCDEPHPAMAGTRFRPLAASEPWEERRRLAGVNAFGFGGINAHVVLESHGARAVRRRHRPGGLAPEEILVLAADSPGALREALESGRTEVGEGACRLALVDPTPARRTKALEVVRAGKPRRGRDGLWFNTEGLLTAGGQVAFLFPGIEAAFEDRISDIARHFNRPSPPTPPGTVAGTKALEYQGAMTVFAGRLLFDVLGEVGIKPSLLAGHSIGEWTGMIAAGIIPADVFEEFWATLTPGSLEVPGVVFAAVGASAEAVRPLVTDLDGVVVTHDNCPHQVILCGPEAQLDTALVRLRDARFLGQKLPFRSGFHSPVFADYLAPHRERFARLALGASKIPLWSATTCRPYPSDPKAIERLALDHLVRPVRFRELILALYEHGVRAFVQLGFGSLVGFVDDTLRGREHVALSAGAPQRSGLEQLRRVAAALFVEGAPVDWTRLFPSSRGAGARIRLELGVPLVRLERSLEGARIPHDVRAPERGADSPVQRGFEAVMQELVDSQEAVRRAWTAGPAPPSAPREKVVRRRLSVKTDPHLLDHCLIPQRPGWPSVADRNPVVPMTMMIRMMMDAAVALVPDRVPIAVEDLLAHTWLAVEPPVEVAIRTTLVAPDRVRVVIEGSAEAVVVLAERYPQPPAAPVVGLTNPRPSEVSGAALYEDRWMFHGPAYRSVTEILEFGEDGIRGRIRPLPAEGALLDGAGQLFGYWVMQSVERDRLAMPIKLGALRLFGPEPREGEELVCTAWCRHLGRREVRAEMMITDRDGHPWARLEGWTDWRFETDERLWRIMRRAERHLFAEMTPEGLAVVFEPERSAASRDYLARRFLNEEERRTWAETLAPRRRTPWLYGRIAAKDAVRHWLMARARGFLFPAEIAVENDETGRPRVAGPQLPDLRLSIAHKETIAVAFVGEGREVGVDVERYEPRSAEFGELICAPEELRRLPTQEREAWLTRVFCAKEVIGKRLGTGLAAAPKRLPVTAVEASPGAMRVRIKDEWVTLRDYGEHVIGWSDGT